MSFSYDTSLAADRDWVRLALGDTVEADAVLSDEEIDAMLALEANKQLAAWRLGVGMMSRWQAASASGGSVVEKQVGRLRVRFADGVSGSGVTAFNRYLEQLLHEGRRLATPRPKVFRSL